MRVLFEGGPHDGGVLDVDWTLPFIRLHALAPSTEYDPTTLPSSTAPEVRVYTYKRWKIAKPKDEWRVEYRYCLDDGRKPLGVP